MAPTTEFQGQHGVNFVERILLRWEDVWNPFPAAHDKGIDGLIHFCRTDRRGQIRLRVPTGRMIMVQIKTGGGYLANAIGEPEHVRVNVGADYISRHRQVWAAYPEPVILIYVLPKSSLRRRDRAWWTNLKSPESFSETNRQVIQLPVSQTFGQHSKGDLLDLLGSIPNDDRLPTVECVNGEANVIRITSQPKRDARDFYATWADSAVADRTNAVFGEIQVSRSGWRHITRRKRSHDRILQSFLLLPAARKIIAEVGFNGGGYLGHAKSQQLNPRTKIVKDYVGLRAMVTSKHRGQAVVQVVLRRLRFIDNESGKVSHRVWFHSVYELRRHAKQ